MSSTLQDLFGRQDIIEIVSTSVAATISQYTHVRTTAGPAKISKETRTANPGAGAVIRYTSASFSMELFLGFEKELFLALYENTFDQKITQISRETQDLAGELLNISFGTIDPRMRGLGFKLKSSFPKSYFGQDAAAFYKNLPAESLIIPLQALNKDFELMIFPPDSLKVKWAYTPT